VVGYHEAEYRDHQVQGFFCHFGLDTADLHRLPFDKLRTTLDQRNTFEMGVLHYELKEGRKNGCAGVYTPAHPFFRNFPTFLILTDFVVMV